MTTVTVTNVELRPDLTPKPFGRVKVGIVGVGWQGDGSLITNVAKDVADVNGLVTFALAPSPAGTWYVWNHSDGINQSTFQVPSSGGPYTLQALLVTAPAAAADPATTQAAVLALLASAVPGLVDTEVAGQLSNYVALSMTPVLVNAPAASASLDTAALTAGIATPARQVWLGKGTYLLNADLVPAGANIKIKGHGIDVTTVQIVGTNRGFVPTNIPGFELEDLTIDCNKGGTSDGGTNTAQQGVLVSATNSTGCPGTKIRRVKIINSRYHGINALATTATTNPLDVDITDCVVTDTGVSGNTGSLGILVTNSTRTNIEKSTVQRCGGYGIKVAGGSKATIKANVSSDNLNNHGIVANTGIAGVTIEDNFCYNNNSSSGQAQYGIVAGIDAINFVIKGNHLFANDGGITADVAEVDPSVFVVTNGVIEGNVIKALAVGRSDSIHVNHADGLTISGNTIDGGSPSSGASKISQDGISVSGRNATVVGNTVHGQGRRGIAFLETGDGCGPHFLGPNNVYGNNTVAGSWTDYYTDVLTNGGVKSYLDDRVNTVATSGSAQTLPWSPIGTMHAVTLSANCTITLPPPRAGASMTVALTQDATGGRVVTWATPSGSIKWLPNGSAPVLTTTASKTDVITFLCADGTNWLGFVGGLNG